MGCRSFRPHCGGAVQTRRQTLSSLRGATSHCNGTRIWHAARINRRNALERSNRTGRRHVTRGASRRPLDAPLAARLLRMLAPAALHFHVQPTLRRLGLRFRCAAMSDPEGWDPVADTVGAGIYSGKVVRDAAGAVVYGAQYAGHNPRPGPVYAGGGYTDMATAIQRGPDAVAALLAAGADPNEEATGGARPLHTCGMSRRGQASVKVLLAAGAQVDALDTYGYTPLHRMASNDLADGARALLEAGADVNAATSWTNQTPLFIANLSGAHSVAKVLAEAGGREF